MMEKNKKNKLSPQAIYDYLIMVLNDEIKETLTREVAIEYLDQLIEMLMDGEGWQG